MIEVLNFDQALQKESDLWVIPNFENSEITSKLNWYMNFQLSQLEKQNATVISSTLSKVLDETGLPQPASHKTELSLIASSGLLPCRWVMVVPEAKKQEEWLQKALKAWEGLKKPSCHFFLPKDFDGKQVVQYLKNEKIEGDFNLVLH